MKILFVASECTPIAKVGGLADVVGSLPKYLKKIGVDVSILIPFYGAVSLKKEEIKLVSKEEKFNLWQTVLPESEVPVFLIENNDYFKGDVYIESDASSGGSEMEAKRFLFLSTAAIEVAKMLKINILHCNDWHTAIVASLFKDHKIKTLLTIHNLQYQGIYSTEIVNKLLGTNFSGEIINCLKEGILAAQVITTVSPSYAKEIMTPEYGCGLEKELQKRRSDLFGILNGLDIERFNPQKDPNLKLNYSIKNLEKKEENKIYLQKKCFGKTDPKVPVLGMVGRLTEQKGIDLIEKIFPSLMKENIQFVLLGTGKKEFEVFFEERKKEFPQKFWAKIGFDDELARQIYAGADMFLMPSLFEPCGLGQLIAMRYGTLPIVRLVGGLKDTVDKETGFLFKNYDAQEFLQAIKKALEVYENKKIWEKLQKNGMKKDFSWEKSAKKYLEIYKKLMATS